MALGKAMTSVVIDLTMSLDGFVAGPNDGPKHPLGTHGGEHLFDWYHGGEVMRGDKRFAPMGRDRDVVDMMFEAYGVFVTGRRTYDITNGWDGTHPMVKNVIVVTHQPPVDVPKGESTFEYVRSIDDAIVKAKKLVTTKAIVVGTARIAQQALAAGLVDELFLHIAPIVLGRGLRLLDKLGTLPITLQQAEGIVGPQATHVRYRVIKTST
jgi:dihydrofolate reductase